jgi:RND family efflux transporter MFP subunit
VVALPVHPDSGTGGGGVAVRYPVEVAARYSNPMSFRVPGKLVERKVRIGDVVKKGEVVARLDPVDAQRQAASARAALDAAEHRLLFARQQLDRDTAQSAQNLIAANQLEQTQDAFTAAQSAREEAESQWVVARNNLEYNTLVADHDGVITSENADTGQVVAAGQAVYGLAWSGDTDVTLDAAASDLARIAVGQSATVTFPALPGQRFDARVREITPAADPQSRTYRVKLTLLHPGSVVHLGMTGDAVLGPMPTGSESAAAGMAADAQGAGRARQGVAAGAQGTGRAGAGVAAADAHGPGRAGSAAAATGAPGADSAAGAVTNTRGTASGAGSGASVSGSNGVARPPTFTLPATAIFHQGNSPAVWVVASNSTLELRPVTVSVYTDHSTVVTKGLEDGDLVVLAGVHTVYAGEHVTAQRPLFDDAGDVEGAAQ